MLVIVDLLLLTGFKSMHAFITRSYLDGTMFEDVG
jgi:hypothetical protein